MDAHLFRLFCKHASLALTGARIEKIQEFASNHLAISFYGANGKQYIYFRFGRKEPFCFIGNERVAALPKPTAQVMRLRKYFAAKRIASVISQVWSRRLWLMAATETPVWLCLDLVHGPSIHFPESENLPEPEVIDWNKQLANLQTPDLWRELPVFTPPLRATLAALDSCEQAALMADLADGNGDVFLYRNGAGSVQRVCAWPLPAVLAAGLEEQAVEDVLAALETAGRDLVLQALFETRQRAATDAASRRQKQLQKLLEKLDRDRERFLAMRAGESDGRALAAALWRLNPDARQKSVIVDTDDGEKNISLDPRFSSRENMERLFHNARRAKRGLQLLEQRSAQVKAELGALGLEQWHDGKERGQAAPAPCAAAISAPPHCQGFLSSDGFVILRGKDAKGNQSLRRHAAGHDIWTHVEQGAGAHVLIRVPYAGYEIPEQTLLEAGTLAINRSWLSGAASGAVMYAEARHIRSCRSGPPGKVLIDKIRATRIVPVDHALEGQLQAGKIQNSS